MGQNVKSLLADKEAVLFDVDGTLVQSNEMHASAWAEVLQRFGHEITAAEVWPLIGKGGDKILPELIGIDAESPEGKEITEARTKIFIEHYAPRVKAIPCASELVDYLQKQGKKIVIATSASKEELNAILKSTGLEGRIPDMTSSDDAEASKPDPDIIAAALKKAGTSADQAVMIGDTPYDVEASVRAGISVIALRCGGWSDEDFEGATAVCEGPEELLTELCRTPESSALQPTPPQGEAAL
ncbi:HAD family hydrolase [Oligoflexus tunisiensis]|uniref:HAD family hydrolase n=1 Tax=Oligoflexus tunisiensis TaxID=708132 RepID=UPI000A52CB8F|nr:HAD family hydrolase [Oligoflexus tunisiensis]